MLKQSSIPPLSQRGSAGRRSPHRLALNAGHGHLGWTLDCGSGRVLAALMDGAETGLQASTRQSLAA
jgi:glycine/D-amino acid oxidase-like deaminating enzyme